MFGQASQAMATWVSALAMVATAVIAFYATRIARTTIEEARRSQRETTAKRLWQDYEKMAFKNPIFAAPSQHTEVLIDLEKRTLSLAGESPNNKQWQMFEQYEWYVSLLLNACEEIYSLYDNKPDPDWKNSMSTQVGFHAEYIKSIGATYLQENYRREFARFVLECIETPTPPRSAG